MFLLYSQWTSRNLTNKHSLHPIFSHGSTLGLYEVLIGKPYICNMVTDSVVHCFFIKSEKILSLLMSDPAIEDFLWQLLPLIAGVNSLIVCHAASRYQVETRARVMIFFDIGVSDADGALQKRSASWITQSGEPQRPLSKEHTGLLSWPEHLYKATGHHLSPNESIKQSTSFLSAKAVELSIYGSMVSEPELYIPSAFFFPLVSLTWMSRTAGECQV
ncbi:hypothetical protein GW17_00015665 [Ensete ventricosum]|nr:hypothetical protein GW17_00015665 [Ensete ventricosum]